MADTTKSSVEEPTIRNLEQPASLDSTNTTTKAGDIIPLPLTDLDDNDQSNDEVFTHSHQTLTSYSTCQQADGIEPVYIYGQLSIQEKGNTESCELVINKVDSIHFSNKMKVIISQPIKLAKIASGEDELV